MQNQGSGTGTLAPRSASNGKGIASYFDSPDKVKMVAREGYIQQAGLSGPDQEQVRQGAWDGRIPGFEHTIHTLQNADDLLAKVGGNIQS